MGETKRTCVGLAEFRYLSCWRFRRKRPASHGAVADAPSGSI